MNPFLKLYRFLSVVNGTRKSGMALWKASRSAEGRTKEFTHFIMREWAGKMLNTLGVEVTSKGEPARSGTLFVGNHVSYLDIPLLMSQVPVVFIAKKELSTWPIFGTALKSVDTLFVDRSEVRSRKEAAEKVGPIIKETGQSVAIFPSGTTKIQEEKPWRWGAFLVAKRSGVPIQPFRLTYQPLRETAYIDDDFFPTHLWRLLGCRPIRAQIEFAEPFLVQDPEAEALKWWSWTKELVTPSKERSFS